MSEPNLLEALFTWRPRERVRPEENFLTEALVYLLQTSLAARDAWLRLVLDDRRQVTEAVFETRASHVDDAGASRFPDVKVSGFFEGGKPFILFAEHKWGASYDEKQLRNYASVLQPAGGSLVFVCARPDDFRASESFFSPDNVKYRALQWKDIYLALRVVGAKTTGHEELLKFMENHGLAPARPLSRDQIQAFVRGSGLVANLKVFANDLLSEFDWSFVPKEYRNDLSVTDAYGRVALEFRGPNWRPIVTIGFLYNPNDHRVRLTSSDSIDVMLRVEAPPGTYAGNAPALRVLAAKVAALRETFPGAQVQGYGDTTNKHTLLMVRRSLVDVLRELAAGDEQLRAVHAELEGWCEVVFSDNALKRALAR